MSILRASGHGAFRTAPEKPPVKQKPSESGKERTPCPVCGWSYLVKNGRLFGHRDRKTGTTCQGSRRRILKT